MDDISILAVCQGMGLQYQLCLSLLFHRQRNNGLTKENDIFEKYLKRLDPNDVQSRGKLPS
jgi:hypothetical protein